MTEKQTFTTLLEKHETMEATGIVIPFDVETVFGAKRVPVKVTINGVGYRSTVVRMGGEYRMIVPKKLRDEAGIKAGDHIVVTMERDDEPRTVNVPDDLLAALSKDKKLAAAWEKLSYTHRKEHVLAITEARRPETRAKRIEKTLEMLRK